jgi:uncharacterized protein YbjT (DUF2867 family)
MSSKTLSSAQRILLTGATGYVGGRLAPLLASGGHSVRCLVRDAARLRDRPWASQVDIVEGDVLAPATLPAVLQGVETAYYLVHAMAAGSDFREHDLRAARAFGQAAAAAGVRRIVYLGGLGDPAADLSEHLRSRQETGIALAAAGVPVIEFRAAVVVGAGSLGFEMIRYLTERLPVMICPRWVYTRVQPIAVDDALAYLVAALSLPPESSGVVEIGGADVRTYGSMMTGYAAVRSLRRRLVAVPVLTPLLSSYWVHLVTPIPDDIARPLIEGLRSEVVVHDDLAGRLFPGIRPVDYETAVRRALRSLDEGRVETAWSDALGSSQGGAKPVVLASAAGFVLERRTRDVQALPEHVYAVICGIGGRRGYPFWNWSWRLRGAMDRLVGGVGLRRGRRDPDTLRVGDVLDFWRVEELVPNRLLRLRAEMRTAGGAWLQFECEPRGDGSTRLVQTAYFAPRGLAGHLYWYGLYPVHKVIFSGTIRRLAEAAERRRDPRHD